MPSKSLSELLKLKDNGELDRALRRSGEIGELTSALADALGGDLGANIVSASIADDGLLTIKTTTSAWASRLRFESEQLLKASQAAGRPAVGVRVRVGRPGHEA